MPLNDELYQRFYNLLLNRAGLFYPERRRNDLAYALNHAARAGGYASLHQLADAASTNAAAWEAMIAELTIGETYFFRNAAHFEALRRTIAPDLVERRTASGALRLWSAGCATGEEPYSLAMVLGEILPNAPRWQVSILATDINARFLQRAREASYSSWSFRETSDALRERYFTAEGTRWRLRPEIRRQVIFNLLNLVEDEYPSPINGTIALDLIVCRNVTIYFDEPTTRRVVERFYRALTPGGWLLVGHAEPHTEIYRHFETHNVPGAVLYRKPLNAPVFHNAPLPEPPAPPAPARTIPPVTLLRPNPAPAFPAASPVIRQLEPPAPPAPTADEQFGMVRAAADRGDWAGARTHAEQLTAAFPLYAPVHFLLGQIYEHDGDLEAALVAYRRSIYLDPTLVMGTLGMAHVFRQDGNTAHAQRALRSVLRQLERMQLDAPVPYAGDATVADLLAYVRNQLAAME